MFLFLFLFLFLSLCLSGHLLRTIVVITKAYNVILVQVTAALYLDKLQWHTSGISQAVATA